MSLISVACSGEARLGGNVPQGESPISDLDVCRTETNKYRATLGLPPLERNDALEAFAIEGAKQDTQNGQAHGHFGRQDPLVAFAENECPSFLGWTLHNDVRTTIADCIEAFYKEGEGGGHYENLMGDYKNVACGVYLTDDGGITITQDFN